MSGIGRRALARRLAVAAGVLAAPGLMRSAAAASVPAPSGKVILTVSGAIANSNRAGAIDFDVAMLEGLGRATVSTTTPWFQGVQQFEGVAMARLMAFVGATGEKVSAQALNDYSTDIPVEDFSAYPVILALKRNGDYMPVSDKGPLFVVYPYDSDPMLKHERYYGRSAWQVRRLVVR